MASPISTGKKSVDLAPGEVRVSKIRREPPPPVKELVIKDPSERDPWVVAIGVISFALAIFIIILAVGSYMGWTPSQYTVRVRM
jgi:hypothetical protein